MTRVAIPEGKLYLQVEMCRNCKRWSCDKCGGVFGFAEVVDKELEAAIEREDMEEDMLEHPARYADMPLEQVIKMEVGFNGISKSIAQWCWQRGLNPVAVYDLFKDGFPIRGLLFVRFHHTKGFTCPELHKWNGEDYCVSAIAEQVGLSSQMLQRTMHDLNMTAMEAVDYMLERKRTHTRNGRLRHDI